MKAITFILILVCLILAYVIYIFASEPYIEDCIIGNTSLRDQFESDHPEMTAKEKRSFWNVEQYDGQVRSYYEAGICDKVVLV